LTVIYITRHQLSEFILVIPELRPCLATYIFWVKITRNVCAISGTEAIGQFTGTRVTFLGEVSRWFCAWSRGCNIMSSFSINLDISLKMKENEQL
jgi:hypothetical protein